MISSYLLQHKGFNQLSLLSTPTVETNTQQQIEFLYEHYQYRAIELDKALSFFRGRALNDTSIKQFKLGFADTSLCRLFQQVPNQAAFREILKRFGFLSPKGHQLCLGCAVFPIIENGQIKGAYGRRISTVSVRMESTIYPFYLANENLLFNQDYLHTQPKCILLCKSPLEAVSAMQLSDTKALSLVGSIDFNEAHAEHLKTCGVKLVKLAFNLSEYYQDKTQKIAELLADQRIKCRIADLPSWQDINHLLCHEASAKKRFHRLLRQARSV